MKRKLIEQGKGGFTIYLPKKWIDKKGLKAGEEIDIVEKSNYLVIGSGVKGKKGLDIKIDDNSRHGIRHLLTHYYRNGYDTMRLSGLMPQDINKIKTYVTNLLLGFEVTGHDNKSLVLENISEPTEDKYPILLRRIFLMIKESISIIKEEFDLAKYERLNEIKDLRDQHDKFILFCRRIITKEKYDQNPIIEWELLTFLMHIEHALYYLYIAAHECGFKKDRDVILSLDMMQEYYIVFYNAHFRQDESLIHKLNQKKPFNKVRDMIIRSKGDKALILSHIREVFRWIQLGTSPIWSSIIDSKTDISDI